MVALLWDTDVKQRKGNASSPDPTCAFEPLEPGRQPLGPAHADFPVTWAMEVEAAATHCCLFCSQLPFLLANGKPLRSGGTVSSLGDGSKAF